MNFRILAASIRPRGRAFSPVGGLGIVGSVDRFRARRPSSPRRRPGAPAAHAAPAAAPKAAPKAAPAPPGSAQAPGQAARLAAAAQPPEQQVQLIYAPWTKFCLEGSGSRRQAGLLHRQGRPHRVGPARHRRRHHRAGRRAEEAAARDAAARHAARARHPDHRRQQCAAAEPLRHLLRRTVACPTTKRRLELIASLKKGQNLVVQAINSNGAPLTLPLPLGGRIRQGL